MKMNLPFIRPLLTSGAVLLLAAACSSGSLTSAWTFIPPQPTGSPGPSGAAATPCPSGSNRIACGSALRRRFAGCFSLGLTGSVARPHPRPGL